MVSVQKCPYFKFFFFRQYRPGKCLLRNSRTKKCLSNLEKQEVQKSQKIYIFSTGLTRGFGPNLAIFPSFYFRQYRPGKWLLRYSRTKKRLSTL